MLICSAFLARCGSGDDPQDATEQAERPAESSTGPDTQPHQPADAMADSGTAADASNAPVSSVGTDAEAENATDALAAEDTTAVDGQDTARMPSVESDDSSPGEHTAAPKDVDHALFDRLLSRAVSNGRVNYGIFRNNAEFNTYLSQLANADVRTMSTNEQLAFWINAYNALVIKNVLDNPGIKRPLDAPGFFDKTKFNVGGQTLTLNQIENDIVRPKYNEPLIHFGLVCAALSCPPLLKSVYTAGNVRRKLADNARAYLASEYNRYEASTNALQLSQIFEWYKSDFGGNDKGLKAFAKKYGPPAMQQGIDGSTIVLFIEYDWTLNSR
jgi:hypothetical protein